MTKIYKSAFTEFYDSVITSFIIAEITIITFSIFLMIGV